MIVILSEAKNLEHESGCHSERSEESVKEFIMVRIKPFAAIRPPKELVEEVAARPYDVLNSEEARAEAGEKSLLHITKPEIDFDPVIDL